MNLDTRLATRIHSLRKSCAYSLEKLAELSGVSRSMISLIERAETSATAAVLNKLADALGVSLASLFSEEAEALVASPLSRAEEQPVWQDPASGYLRRQLSPPGYGSPIELAEVTFQPGQKVTFDNAMRSIVTHQQIWMLDGEMDITAEGRTWHLQPGDCLAMVLGQQIMFRNPTSRSARYLIALTATPSSTGRQ
ncbi:helix-turn-helix domain-containing protein [Pseudogulbenkiania subflava]|uniref:Transcriptional regulator, XRE family with cupin sensor n=1 Tax=Pseudogulbenkiania subflava DSM 22618 TaxID=1123014 RepID=A0A1Y6CA92_9NEIS|nr:XRE family transcriptional regulator [Pseudogulbenkiania subflava]SMF44614.1 transcriptional regulator, XRE family with cupin sensor [Pseudogulbenkiania subflava DSM 22618]